MSRTTGEHDTRHPGLNLAETDTFAHAEAEETVFGFWVFLMSDVVLFALLIAVYATTVPMTDGGPGPRDILKLGPAAFETGLLLLSSLSFGMASLALKYGEPRRRLVGWLALTLVLGLAFLGLELKDFADWAAQGAPPQRSGFLSALFVLLSTHGLHVAIGCLWIAVMIAQVFRFATNAAVKLRIMRLALFWHMLDVVWIGLFSVIYLVGLSA
ncbi:cytochrome c oxidase subunit 3 [Aureimonas sp. AU4]|uniref:cytochrome c oxidase subunit 3 n=1 Tax=Aureimonas sp. AU4 TaxID=1638163 RepID=UPI000783B7C0|nr:cytochrome c oxidase subunit 3 [Aureimonas sp. AU4]